MTAASAVQVLVLNKAWAPVGLADVERAMGLLLTGAAKALDANYQLFDFESWADVAAEYGDDVVRTPNKVIKIPRVVVLQAYDRLPRTKIRFSRNNVYLRDQFTCAYCAKTLPRNKLNLDHVTPRSKGGRTSWENIVTSCYDCNLKKGDKSPDQVGMKLRFQPTRPTWGALAKVNRKVPYKEWLPFVDPVSAAYWNTELED